MARKTLIGKGAALLKSSGTRRHRESPRASPQAARQRGKKATRALPAGSGTRIETIAIEKLKPAAYNPRKADATKKGAAGGHGDVAGQDSGGRRPQPKEPKFGDVVDSYSVSMLPGIRLVPLRKIKPAPYNPRRRLKDGDPEYEKLKQSIKKFGFVEPLVWNEQTGHLVGGHQRFEVLKTEFGVKTFSCVVVNVDPVHEKAMNVALNKVSGTWDEQKLTELLRELQFEGEASATGFDQTEIDALLAEVAGHGAGEGDTSPQLGGMQFRVVVDCTSESDQRQMLERFEKEKRPCRALMS